MESQTEGHYHSFFTKYQFPFLKQFYSVRFSAGTLCFDNNSLMGSLKWFICSAGFNQSQLIGSAEQAQI